MQSSHSFKAGRYRPESALKLGKTARGICTVCQQPKGSHSVFKGMVAVRIDRTNGRRS